MATRNLTSKFKTFRENVRNRRPGSIDPTNAPPRIGKDTLAPFWVETVEDVNNIIADIKTGMDRLNEAHRKRLLVSFDETGEAEKEREINVLTSQLTGRFRDAEKFLRVIGASNPANSADEAAVRTNLTRSIATQLQTLSIAFRKSQKEYMSKLKMQKNNIGFGTDLEAPKEKLNIGLTDGEEMMLSTTVAEIQDRDEEIQRIAQSIEELSVIFKELANLVIDQGTILDRIDYNMENVVTSVKKGNEELKIAAKYKKSNRPMYLIACLVVLILIFLIILWVR